MAPGGPEALEVPHAPPIPYATQPQVMPCTMSGLIMTPQSWPQTYFLITAFPVSGSISTSTICASNAQQGYIWMRPSGVGKPPPVGTPQTNFACSPGSSPAGILWNLRCAISTSWSQVSVFEGAP